jgi:hypothetical protein
LLLKCHFTKVNIKQLKINHPASLQVSGIFFDQCEYSSRSEKRI